MTPALTAILALVCINLWLTFILILRTPQPIERRDEQRRLQREFEESWALSRLRRP